MRTRRWRHLMGLGVALSVGWGPAGSVQAQGCDPVETATLLGDGGPTDDAFGFSVSVSGNTALVGAPWHDRQGTNSGSAFVFEVIGGVWTPTAELTADDGGAWDLFGSSVSVSGDTAIVGADRHDDQGEDTGSAFIFERVGGVWTQTDKLTPDESGYRANFGWSVCISGDTAIVGALHDDDNGFASGSAYVFERIGGVWTQAAKLTADDGAAYDKFGYSVSVSEDTAFVGAYWDDDHGGNSGSVYVFEKIGGIWTQTTKLTADDGVEHANFGRSIAVDRTTAFVGAVGYHDYGYTGSAYVFERIDGFWIQAAKLTADDGAAEDRFGVSVSVSGDTAVVGAHYDDDNGPDSGSAYVFERVDGIWTQAAKLIDEYGQWMDFFGYSVSISGETAIVGAYFSDDRGNDSGSAYVFNLHCTCPADFNADGDVDTRDVIAFLGAWAAGEPDADFNQDGAIDTRDVIAFLGAWAAGC